MMGLNHISYSCGKLFTWSKFIFESENGSSINCIFRSSSLASFQHIWMPMWSGSLVVDIELLNWLEQGHSVRSEPLLHLITTISHYPSGSTYAGYDVSTGEKVAIKLEPRSLSFFHLENECTIYRYLGLKCPGIPHLRWSGTEHDYSAVVLSLLGPSLESLFSHNKRGFTLRVVATIAEQLVRQSFQFVPIYWLSWNRFLALSRSTDVILFTET